MNVAPVRLAIAAVCFVLSLMALRVAIRRLIRALAVWLLGGALFMTAILLLVAGSWRMLRARLARRRPRPAA